MDRTDRKDEGRLFRANFQILNMKPRCGSLCVCGLTCAPLRQVGAGAGEPEDPGVAVAVGHKDVPGGGVHGHVGGLAEVAAVTSWSEGLAQRQQGRVPAVAAHLQHLTTQHTAGHFFCTQTLPLSLPLPPLLILL